MSIASQFNRIAEEYDQNRRRFLPCFDEFYQKTTAFLLSSLPAPRRVLDLGAGTGLLSFFWRERCPGAEYVLTDVAEDMLQVARKRFDGAENVRYLTMDYSRQLPQGPFDAVISALSVHHLEDAEKQALFRRIYEALPEGGVFVNYDQFCAQTPLLSRWYDSYWEGQLAESGLTEHDLALWRERRKLDRECSVEAEVEMLRESGFPAVQCVYACQKFAVLAAVKHSNM